MKYALLLMAVWTCAASAQVTPVDTLQGVAAERQQVLADSTQAEVLCYKRFAVNSCLEDVFAQRRSQLTQLKQREAVLKNLQRAERAQEQLQRLQEKQQERLARDDEAAQRAASALVRSESVPQAPNAVPPASDRSTSALDPADAAANRAAYDAKVAEALRHKAEVAKRLEEQTDRAQPLPVLP